MSTIAAPTPSVIMQTEPELVPARGGQRSMVLHRFLGLADALGSLAAGGLAGLIIGLDLDVALALGAGCAIMLPLLAFLCGLYAADGLRAWATGVPDLKRMLFATLALSWPLFGVAELAGVERTGLLTLLGATLTFGLVTTGRAVARTIVHRSDRLRERTAIVGSGIVAGEVVDSLRRHSEFGLVPVGVFDNVEHHRDVHDLPHLGALNELTSVLRRNEIDRVIIAFSRANHVELLQVIRACRDNRVPVHIVPRLFEFLDGARSLDYVGGMPLLSLGVPRLTRVAHAAKRGFDIAVSAAGLLVLAPFFAVVALMIKIETPGPVLFRQARGGRDGRSFNLIKFRSMYDGADAQKAALLDANEMPGGVMFKIRRDPRITRVGNLLRRYSLDELPQLWNVLRGEMSLVGPRPLVIPEAIGLDEDWHARRNDLRPGLTGPWQVYGRSELPFHVMVRFDYQYVAGWSLARDLEILLATVPAVLSGRGAY